MTSILAGIHFNIRVGYGDIVSFQKEYMASPRVGKIRKIERVTVESSRGVNYTVDKVYIESCSYSKRHFDECICEPLHILERIVEWPQS